MGNKRQQHPIKLRLRQLHIISSLRIGHLSRITQSTLSLDSSYHLDICLLSVSSSAPIFTISSV